MWNLGFLLLVGLIVVAWLAHEAWFAPAAAPPPRASTAVARTRPAPHARTRPAPRPRTRPAATTESQPATDLTDPWEDLEVQPLGEDPVGFPPPQGATGRAHRMPDSSIVARYSWPGTQAGAADHYKKALAEAGGRLLEDSAGEEGWQYLKFDLQGKRVIAALRANPQDARIVDIVVTLVRPEK
jgi:hypothetical protein